MNNKELADLLFPHIDKTIEDYLTMYPSRGDNHIVTRVAPSPTGFMHIGTVYSALIGQRFAEQNKGTFILRIEDTDTARTVEGAVDDFISHFNYLSIPVNEGPLWPNNADIGNYGPYHQSHRKEIYHTFIKHLVANGHAYPCWLSPEEMDSIRAEQRALKKAPGIYGNYSVWRNKTNEEYVQQYQQDPEWFVIRFRSEGKLGEKVLFEDVTRGKIHMADNVNDNVIMKSGDKLPTYHLAHVVDDTLMRTSHVVRGEEWLTSVPFHLQMFEAFTFPVPVYVHTAQILKVDEGKKRKLSKRKDPESDIAYFFASGYPKQGILDYLMSIIDSKYESWMEENPDKDYTHFTITIQDLNSSGALVDYDKINHVNNRYLSRISNEQLYTETLEWAEQFMPDLAQLMHNEPEYTIAALGIERHTDQDPKRFTNFFDVEKQLRFFYDSEFMRLAKEKPALPDNIDTKTMLHFVDEYEKILDVDGMDKMEWFTQLKEFGKKHWFAANNREFKEWGYNGKVGDIAMFMRIQLACSKQTPDLYHMMKVMGKERVFKRLRHL